MKNLKLFFGVAVTAALLTASCNKIVEATSITLDNPNIVLDIRQTQTLVATVLPENTTDKSVIWTSDNNDVASVEDGVVTAKWQGTATITATSSNNLSTRCVVTVKGVETINGVRWAICNVGEKGKFTSKPEDFGGYYTFDEAKNACPEGWRLPDYNEFGSLIDPKVIRVQENGNGLRFTDNTTNQSIFLPAAGRFIDNKLEYPEKVGDYRCSEEYDDERSYSYYFFYETIELFAYQYTPKTHGLSVRCVDNVKK